MSSYGRAEGVRLKSKPQEGSPSLTFPTLSIENMLMKGL